MHILSLKDHDPVTNELDAWASANGILATNTAHEIE